MEIYRQFPEPVRKYVIDEYIGYWFEEHRGKFSPVLKDVMFLAKCLYRHTAPSIPARQTFKLCLFTKKCGTEFRKILLKNAVDPSWKMAWSFYPAHHKEISEFYESIYQHKAPLISDWNILAIASNS